MRLYTECTEMIGSVDVVLDEWPELTHMITLSTRDEMMSLDSPPSVGRDTLIIVSRKEIVAKAVPCAFGTKRNGIIALTVVECSCIGYVKRLRID